MWLNWESSHIVCGDVKWCSHCEKKTLAVGQKVKHSYHYDPTMLKNSLTPPNKMTQKSINNTMEYVHQCNGIILKKKRFVWAV